MMFLGWEIMELQRKRKDLIVLIAYIMDTQLISVIKFMGYPPGYMTKSKENSQGYSVQNPVKASHQATQQPNMDDFMQNLNSSLYQQLMTMLSNHLGSRSSMAVNDQDKPTTSGAAGICHSISVIPTFTTKKIWIVDLGATRHVCCTADAFINLRNVGNASVTLPNHTRI